MCNVLVRTHNVRTTRQTTNERKKKLSTKRPIKVYFLDTQNRTHNSLYVVDNILYTNVFLSLYYFELMIILYFIYRHRIIHVFYENNIKMTYQIKQNKRITVLFAPKTK